MPDTLDRLQAELAPWVEHNFPDREPWQPLMGALEELGELAHAHLKSHQGIRGTAAEHDAAKRDAVGDAVVFLADYCNAHGYSLRECVEGAWEIASKRDWAADALKGER